MYKPIELKSKERYSKGASALTNERLEKVAEFALNKLRANAEKFGDSMVTAINGWNHYNPKSFSHNCYNPSTRVTWKTGIWTGLYWLAYQYSGDLFFKNVAESFMKHFIEEVNHPERLDDHDTGFKYLPSCVAAYKVTGEEKYKEAALKAADILYSHCCQVNKFIIRVGDGTEKYRFEHYRTLVDSMMNIPLFFWATEVTGDKKYRDMAIEHYRVSAKYLIREDGSSYHHYQFDPKTKKPLYGVTHQGHRDESCWTRGHAWLVYGYPNAYKYSKDPEALDFAKAVSYYFMDKLPEDGVPYWDTDFEFPSFQPRDSSASAIASCGLLEMCKYLPDSAEEKIYFKNAAEIMIEAIIDKCICDEDNTDAIITHVTNSVPHNEEIDSCETFGDYFFFEALVRLLRPEIKLCW